MGHSVLLHILILSLFLCANLENAKGRSLLVPTSAPFPLSSASLLDEPLARRNAPTKAQNSTDTGSPIQMDTESHRINKGLLLAIIILPIFVGCIMISSVCTWLYRKAYNSAPSSSEPHVFKRNLDPDTSDAYRGIPLMPLLNRLNSRISKKKGCAAAIEYSKLQAATNNFSSNNILGEGGFGCVYKARFDEDFIAAVKKLDEGSRQAEHEFQNEVELMSKIRHPNLVSLLGFCSHENTRFLVYELMQNGSLEDQLHGPSHGSALTWFLRVKIALDSARGLEHLHEHCNPAVIHRDFKSSNILLDASFNAKVSDFGLAVTTAGCAGNTTIDLVGTLGYVAPEYLLDGSASCGLLPARTTNKKAAMNEMVMNASRAMWEAGGYNIIATSLLIRLRLHAVHEFTCEAMINTGETRATLVKISPDLQLWSDEHYYLPWEASSEKCSQPLISSSLCTINSNLSDIAFISTSWTALKVLIQ